MSSVPPIPSGTPLIGGPKMSDFAPLTGEQLAQLREPVKAAIESGVDPNQMGAVPIGMLAQFFSTIEDLQTQVKKCVGPRLSPIFLRDQPISTGSAEE